MTETCSKCNCDYHIPDWISRTEGTTAGARSARSTYVERHIHVLPRNMRPMIMDYLHEGIEPDDDFLRALLANKLVESFLNADTVNRDQFVTWIKWLHNDAPRGCWGSPEAIQSWVKLGGLVEC